MKFRHLICATGLSTLTLAGAPAQASSLLSDLVADATSGFSFGQVAFNDFQYDPGIDFLIAANSISVEVAEVSLGPNSARYVMTFVFTGARIEEDDEWDIFGSFDMSLTGAAVVSSVRLDLDAAVTGTGLDEAFVEVGSLNLSDATFMDFFQGGYSEQTSVTEGFPNVGGFDDFDWYSQAAAYDDTFDPIADATLYSFALSFDVSGLDDGTPKVPLPASMPLLLGGVAAVGLLRRRRRKPV